MDLLSTSKVVSLAKRIGNPTVPVIMSIKDFVSLAKRIGNPTVPVITSIKNFVSLAKRIGNPTVPVIMSIQDFVSLAKRIGNPTVPVIWISNTGRLWRDDVVSSVRVCSRNSCHKRARYSPKFVAFTRKRYQTSVYCNSRDDRQ